MALYVFCSRSYPMSSEDQRREEEESDEDIEDIIDTLKPEEKWEEGSTSIMKKPVELDRDGEAFGPMKNAFLNDIKKYAQELDPRKGWEGQRVHHRRRLFRRLYIGTSKHFGLSFSYIG